MIGRWAWQPQGRDICDEVSCKWAPQRGSFFKPDKLTPRVMVQIALTT